MSSDGSLWRVQCVHSHLSYIYLYYIGKYLYINIASFLKVCAEMQVPVAWLAFTSLNLRACCPPYHLGLPANEWMAQTVWPVHTVGALCFHCVGKLQLGGTFMNVRYVLQKIMCNTAAHVNVRHDHVAFQNCESKFNWCVIMEKQDAYMSRLNTIYQNNLTKLPTDIIPDHTAFANDPRSMIEVDGVKNTSQHIPIVTGTMPSLSQKSQLPDASLGITSAGFGFFFSAGSIVYLQCHCQCGLYYGRSWDSFSPGF